MLTRYRGERAPNHARKKPRPGLGQDGAVGAAPGLASSGVSVRLDQPDWRVVFAAGPRRRCTDGRMPETKKPHPEPEIWLQDGASGRPALCPGSGELSLSVQTAASILAVVLAGLYFIRSSSSHSLQHSRSVCVIGGHRDPVRAAHWPFPAFFRPWSASARIEIHLAQLDLSADKAGN